MPDANPKQKIKKILESVLEAHHLEFAASEGEDPEWALWYAEHILNSTDFSKIVKQEPTKSELVYMLIKLDHDFNKEKPGGMWWDYYAEQLYQHFNKEHK